MTLSQALEVAAFSVVLGCLFGSAGWIITRMSNRNEARTRQDVLDTVKLSEHDRTITDLCGRVDKVERRVSGHGEELAALGAVMDRHERWHERHDHVRPSESPDAH